MSVRRVTHTHTYTYKQNVYLFICWAEEDKIKTSNKIKYIKTKENKKKPKNDLFVLTFIRTHIRIFIIFLRREYIQHNKYKIIEGTITVYI